MYPGASRISLLDALLASQNSTIGLNKFAVLDEINYIQGKIQTETYKVERIVTKKNKKMKCS
jgi:hypothetical protein